MFNSWKMPAESTGSFDLSVYCLTHKEYDRKRNRSTLQSAFDAIIGGCTFLQVRDKAAKPDELVPFVRQVMVLVKTARGEQLSSDEQAALEASKELSSLRRTLLFKDGLCPNLRCVVNDHVDIAILAGADGAHIGQEDTPVSIARAALDAGYQPGTQRRILGVTAKTVESALQAVAQGADYLGSGAVCSTSTKDNTVPLPLDRLAAICAAAWPVPVVAIGGIGLETVARALLCHEGLTVTGSESALAHMKPVHWYACLPAGVAVCGAVMDVDDVQHATSQIRGMVLAAQTAQDKYRTGELGLPLSGSSMLSHTAGLVLACLRARVPLVQCMTNQVAQDLTANVLLAAGASAAMVADEFEAPEFARLRADALLVNMGTLAHERVPVMEAACRACRKVQGSSHTGWMPVVLDPVGCGGTKHRTDSCVRIAQALHSSCAIIRGNGSEILALASAVLSSKANAGQPSSIAGKGVESLHDSRSLQVLQAAARLADALQVVVAVSGAHDYVVGPVRVREDWVPTDTSVPRPVLIVKNDVPMLTKISAAGCAMTALMAAMAAAVGKELSVDESMQGPEASGVGVGGGTSVLRRHVQAIGKVQGYEALAQLNEHTRGLMLAAASTFAYFAVSAQCKGAAVAGPGSLRTHLVDALFSIQPADLTKAALVSCELMQL